MAGDLRRAPRRRQLAEIAAVLKVNAEQARSDYTEVLDRQERILGRDVSTYREVDCS